MQGEGEREADPREAVGGWSAEEVREYLAWSLEQELRNYRKLYGASDLERVIGDAISETASLIGESVQC